MAAGMKAKLIVEVTSGVSSSTIALAAAARQTGGRLVCILPEPILAESKKVIKDSGLKDIVDFQTGDPHELLPHYEHIDFSLVDCKMDDHDQLLQLIDVNPRRAVVVAKNLERGRKGLAGHVRGMDHDRVPIRSTKHPIGKGGMEVTMIGQCHSIEIGHQGRENREKKSRGGGAKKSTGKSKWVVKVDEESGEEHIFRVPNTSV